MTQYFVAESKNDDGFGFGQGSTAGVFNTYGHRGFARPQLAEHAVKARDNLNMRACMNAYACHFDPRPLRCVASKKSVKTVKKRSVKKKRDTIALLVVLTMVAIIFYLKA